MTLEVLRQQNLLKTQSHEIFDIIINEWLFPLYPLDLNKERMNKKELNEIRERWHPDW